TNKIGVYCVAKHVLHVVVEGAQVRNKVAHIDAEKIFLRDFVNGPLEGAEVFEKIIDRTALLTAEHSVRSAPGEAHTFGAWFWADNQRWKKLRQAFPDACLTSLPASPDCCCRAINYVWLMFIHDFTHALHRYRRVRSAFSELAFDRLHQQLDLRRLHQIIVNLAADRLEGSFKAGVSGEDQCDAFRLCAPHGANDGEAVTGIPDVQVRNEDVEFLRLKGR